MKKFKLSNVAVLLVLAVVLTGCAGVQGSLDGSDSTGGQSEKESSQSEVESTQSEKESSQSEETTTEEPLEDGWTRLTEEELKWFNESFFNNVEDGLIANVKNGMILNSFLNCTYTDVKDISLEELFYDSPHQSTVEITDAEMALLKGSAIDFDTDFQKILVSYMDEMLRTYANITLEETNKVDLDKFLYLEEYEAYYSGHGDTHYSPVTVESGIKDEKGIVKLQCLHSESENKYEVTLQAHEDGYYFVSNVLIEE